MIEFHYETDFELEYEVEYSDWLSRIIGSENKLLERLTFIFCDDTFLLNINQKYLQHDNYTDVITFDYTQGDQIGGDIFISVERVRENADKFGVKAENELKRVMAHGVLHLMGYGDKMPEEVSIMRRKEEEKIKLFHVEQ